ncbi:leucine--tRNA ligase [Cytophagaceae bacterium DM2B3-1]|uniref:Leucine--tRNA ligase n=1 Tax=Xanthocytophaga flava TaxID=3048013 RepID=A0ABT7CSB0_9BACT|nr:leucine--tRNA ligase [Xanthocytophaga flavus]MDJ1496613.1 leucine--tRNA ligase [Xanthocytophaga flavus]
MSEYNFREIEKRWQQRWEEQQTYRTDVDASRPKYYVLDMFPYPSGAGLHVGHPLGYIASDIVSRYKRLQGFNVLHPMGFDSFGLPAEQYAIQTGQHPAVTTENNIDTYISQLKKIGFSYDWSREVRTSDPKFYKWTQWIFMQLFNHYYDKDADKALSISKLTEHFAKQGNSGINAVCDEDTPAFTAAEWNAMTDKQQQELLFKYRLTMPDEAYVNWCAALGSVLSNDEVKDGVSERGGYPVERKLMKQWSMRITAYADRLLDGLNEIDWSDSIKEQQRNWIGRSQGASVQFAIEGNSDNLIEVFTTRVDTIYGVSFIVLAPEHEFVSFLTTPEQKTEVDTYVKWAASRSEVDRMSEVKKVTGVFTGSYAINPFNGEKVPIYLADYVLAGYGTGAVMGVPSGDQRDWNFATHFNLPIIPILDSQKDMDKQADATKEGRYINSGIINGMEYKEATSTLIKWLEERGLGKGKVQYRLRNAVFSRQRYWGEPVPVYYKDGLPQLIDEQNLPLLLPEIDKYLPTETGEPPLGRAENWKYKGQYEYELSTMPGWAGSSWYFYRYMDPQNDSEFASKESVDYWQNVDLYLGGSEHATGHLLYSRFWNHFLYDLGLVPQKEYAKKLINQGMILGRSNYVYRVKSSEGEGKNPVFVSYNLRKEYETTAIHVDVNIVENDELNVEAFKKWRPDFQNAEFILEDGKYICGWEIDKMSKRYYNVVNPDDIVARYGADTLRMYEMFLGPLTDAKPWNTNGISGVHNFLRKLWRLFYNEDNGNLLVTDAEPTREELKSLHKTIKKVADDIENYSFNTTVSAFMICVNELSSQKCSKRAILSDLVVILSPFAPHIAEELWSILGHATSVTKASYPVFNASYLTEDSFEYPISINGKVRIKMTFPADALPADIEQSVLAEETVQKWLEGKAPKKVIVVPKRIVNVVI